MGKNNPARLIATDEVDSVALLLGPFLLFMLLLICLSSTKNLKTVACLLLSLSYCFGHYTHFGPGDFRAPPWWWLKAQRSSSTCNVWSRFLVFLLFSFSFNARQRKLFKISIVLYFQHKSSFCEPGNFCKYLFGGKPKSGNYYFISIGLPRIE